MDVEFARLAAARRIVVGRPATGSVARDRANAERWIARFGASADTTDGATVEVGTRSVVVRPAGASPDGPHVLYVHGGGMVYYNTSVFLPFLRVLARATGATVEAFDYPKAPEHTVAESVHRLAAAMSARRAELAGRSVTLMGDSVGGLLALHLALRVLPGAFDRLVLVYPVLDLRHERDSYAEFGEGFFLDRDVMRRFRALLAEHFLGRLEPFALSGTDLAALPPTTLVTSGCDVLRDEGLACSAR